MLQHPEVWQDPVEVLTRVLGTVEGYPSRLPIVLLLALLMPLHLRLLHSFTHTPLRVRLGFDLDWHAEMW